MYTSVKLVTKEDKHGMMSSEAAITKLATIQLKG